MNKIILLSLTIISFFLTGVSMEIGATVESDAKLTEVTSDDPHNRNVLRFAVHTSALGNTDPHFAKGSQDHTYADMVFNGLLRYVPGDSPRLEPDIAANIPEFKIINGRQIWRINLRQGIMFHAGPQTDAYELTADDVVYSLRKTADPALCLYAYQYTGMKFVKIDRYTIEIIIEKAISPIFFLSYIANKGGGLILSKKALETMGYEAFKKHPIGTGPFMFESYESKAQLKLKANDRYFRGKPLLKGVEIHFIPDNKERSAALRKGEADIIYGVGDPGWIEAMEKDSEITVDVFGAGYMGMLHFNTSMKPMDDIRVRKAITYALDKDLILAGSSKRLVKNAYAPIPGGLIPGGMDNDMIEKLGLFFPRDLKKARQLLAEAGYADGFTLEIVSSEWRIYRKTYEIIRDQLAQIGIKINLKITSHSKTHKLILQNVNPLVLYFTLRPNADVYLQGFFHSDAAVVTGIKPYTNFSHYGKIDKLLEDARSSTDPKKQINLWHQAQIKILNDVMVYPLFVINQCCARKNYVNYGHKLNSTFAHYPQFTEKTKITTK